MNPNRVFAWVHNLFRRCKIKKNKVTLIEKLDTGGSGSLFSLKRECERRELGLSFHIISHRDYEVRPGNFLGLLRLFTVKAYHLATSSYIFLNDNFMPLEYMDLSPETTVVQLWHGMGAFKKFAGSQETDRALLSSLRRVNRKVTHILASAEGIRGYYAQAFLVPEEKILAIGCPQADYYFKRHPLKRWREDFDLHYPQARGKKLALYAPTFRDDEARDRSLLTHFDFDAFQRELGEEYCLMVRLHPQIHGSQVPSSVIDMTACPNVRKLLLLTDLLIADYSSIAVEYSLLARPIILYAFDKDWYLSCDRGFYYDYDTFAPGPVAETMEELLLRIRKGDWDPEQVRRFARLHNDFFDANSCARVADFYFGKEEGNHKMKIIVGLGNPTDQYKGTRHNIGYMAADKLGEKYGISINRHRFKAMTGTGLIGGERVLLMKPLTYMNLSGESIRQVVDFYKTDPEDLLVIYDDISLEPGMLRIRKKGSAGGHNGIKSILSHLGTEDFPRIRVGIGGERHPGMDLADYVLGHFGKEEMPLIEEALGKAVSAAELICAGEIDEAMNRYSVGRKKRKKQERDSENGVS